MTSLQTARMVLGRVVRGRCPRCGVGKIREGGFTYKPSCADCGLVYVRDPVDFGMFLYVSTAAITGLFVIGYLVLGFPTTSGYRFAVGTIGLGLMIGTAPLRRFLAIGVMYLGHVFFDS